MHKPITRFHFVTAVWGAGHRGTFLEIGLPSLLSDRNLPGMSTLGESRYQIFTMASDLPAIESSAAFRYLREIVAVEIDLIDEQVGVAPHTIMSECHRHGLRRAQELSAGTVFVPPDCVWADGAMVNLERIAWDVASTVHMSGLRLVLEDALPELVSRWRAPDGRVLKIPPRDLVALGMRHLHPITKDLFFREMSQKLMPANLLWTVGREGVLARCFHLHPLLIAPSALNATFKTTIDDDLALVSDPDGVRDYVSQDSDEILAFELSAATHGVLAGYSKGLVSDVAAWAEVSANPRHRMLVQKSIRIHSTDMTEALWAPIEREADGVVQGALALLKRSTLYLLRNGLDSNVWHRTQAAKARSAKARNGVAVKRLKLSSVTAAFHAQSFTQLLIYNSLQKIKSYAAAVVFRARGLPTLLVYKSFLAGNRFLEWVSGEAPRIRPWSWRWNFEREVSQPLLAKVPLGVRCLIVLGHGMHVGIPATSPARVIQFARLANLQEAAEDEPYDAIVYFAAPGEAGTSVVSLLCERLSDAGLLHVCIPSPDREAVERLSLGTPAGVALCRHFERGSLGTALLMKVFIKIRGSGAVHKMRNSRHKAVLLARMLSGAASKLAIFPLMSLAGFVVNAFGESKRLPAAAVITLERERAHEQAT